MNLVMAVAFAPPMKKFKYLEKLLTNENNIEISFGSWHISFSFSTSHASRLSSN
jgi:hypothetical protein